MFFNLSYDDDVLISSILFSDHLVRLAALIEKISLFGMMLKLSKYKFLWQRIKFLGHIVTPFGISMDPSKLYTICEFPQSRNKK